MTHYELHTRSNNAFMAFVDKTRALKFRDQHFARVGVKLRLFEVRKVEQEVAA